MDLAFDIQPSWYALRTKPRQEQRAAANLRTSDIEIFLPWLTVTTPCRRTEPLFPGYIFARFTLHQYLHRVSFTRGIAYIVSFGGAPAVVTDEVIATIRNHMDGDMVRGKPAAFNPGDKVVVRSGPLQNLIGIFQREVPGCERIQILLSSIEYSPRLEVSKYAVDKLAAVA
jgi:transcriptional antiterminator RfaH